VAESDQLRQRPFRRHRMPFLNVLVTLTQHLQVDGPGPSALHLAAIARSISALMKTRCPSERKAGTRTACRRLRLLLDRAIDACLSVNEMPAASIDRARMRRFRRHSAGMPSIRPARAIAAARLFRRDRRGRSAAGEMSTGNSLAEFDGFEIWRGLRRSRVLGIGATIP